MNRGPMWGPRTVYAGPTYYSGGAHALFRRDPRAIQAGPMWDPRAIQAGPTRYSDGTHVGPTVLLSEPFYLKKIIFLPLFDNTKYI